MFDLIVRNGTVVDGSGRSRYPADVAVQNGKIVAVGNLSNIAALQELDATGLVVCPGFIDIHSHSDFTLLVDPRAQSAIAQGVTTELVGNCGHGCAPIRDAEAAKINIYGYSPAVAITWHTMAEYLEHLERVKPAVNVLTLVPNGMLRLAVMGLVDRVASPEEVRHMGRLLEEGLNEGAWGFSVGLESIVERAAGTEELTELCRITARYGGLFAPHLRNREVRALEAIEEALQISKDTGVRLHIPHITPRRGGPPDPEVKALSLIDQGLKDGLDISVDMHTRLHGLTTLSSALPPWAFEGGSQTLRAYLSDPAMRREFARYESLITSFSLAGWEHVYLWTSARRPDWAGRSFQDIAEELGTTPFDAVLDVLLEEAENVHFPLCLCESYTEAQLRRTYEHPACMVASDATSLCVDGPLAQAVFHGAYTWASWFFRRFVREEKAFTPEEAVKKLTSQPAERIGLHDRGMLQAGAWADLAIWDANTFGECGTLREPNRLAKGMKHVIVNGVIEMRDGKFTGARAGQVLRRA